MMNNMKTKIILLLIFISYLINNALAQDIEVKKFGSMEKDYRAALNPRKNINGAVCGLSKVLLNEPRIGIR